jgi:hypothetical protein
MIKCMHAIEDQDGLARSRAEVCAQVGGVCRGLTYSLLGLAPAQATRNCAPTMAMQNMPTTSRTTTSRALR